MKIIGVILIFVIGRFLAKQLTIFSRKIMIKARIDITLVVFLSNIIYFTLLLMVFIAALNALDINTTSFIAVLGAAVIIIFRPFKVDDLVEVSGVTGVVKEINLFSTILEPVDKSIVTMKNLASSKTQNL
ncbi:MAG: mechanosensitive ion channel [Sulfurimonadaceae bacterium]|nr:mechanosensitive ion channel [Sulfurimonadaceae bacterium]